MAVAEREANDRLKREEPAALEVKMRAQLPTSKCCLCGETFKGYGHNAHPVRNEGVAYDACNAGAMGRSCCPSASSSGRREPRSRPERDRRPVGAGYSATPTAAELGHARGSVWPNEPLDHDSGHD